MRQLDGQATTVTDVLIVTSICFGWFILGSIQAVASNFPSYPFTDSSFFRIIVLESILAAAAIGYLRIRGFDLALLAPAPTFAGCLVGVALYAAAALASWPLQLLMQGEQSAIQPIEHMVANSAVSLAPLVTVSVVNGLYEETFLVGYLQRALEASGPAFAIGASLLVRVLYHLYQGPAGAISVLGFGLVLGIYFLAARKLWPVVFAHIAADIAGFSSL